MDHIIGGGQVQPYSAGLKADQEEGERGVLLETIDLLLPVFGLPVQVSVADVAVVQLAAQDMQRLDKLRKYERFVAFGAQRFQCFVENLELRGFSPVGGIDKHGVNADLAQPQQAL